MYSSHHYNIPFNKVLYRSILDMKCEASSPDFNRPALFSAGKWERKFSVYYAIIINGADPTFKGL